MMCSPHVTHDHPYMIARTLLEAPSFVLPAGGIFFMSSVAHTQRKSLLQQLLFCQKERRSMKM